jgi:hypothetical protein
MDVEVLVSQVVHCDPVPANVLSFKAPPVSATSISNGRHASRPGTAFNAGHAESPHLRAKAGVDDRIGVAAREMQALKRRLAGVVKSRRAP